MSDVWDFIILQLQYAVQGFKSIPVWQGDGVTVYLWEFLIALLILSVVATATVSVVTLAPGMTYDRVQSENRAAASKAEREAWRNEIRSRWKD